MVTRNSVLRSTMNDESEDAGPERKGGLLGDDAKVHRVAVHETLEILVGVGNMIQVKSLMGQN